jgi:ribosomal protein L11
MVKRDEARLEEARTRFHTAVEADSRQREEAIEDLRFRAGEQWPDQVLTARTLDKRPSLTIDKLSQSIRQIINAQRQSRIAIDVLPESSGADQDTAEVFQGLIRQIEVESDANAAYSWAFEQAVTCGRGFWRVLTEYAAEDDFDQVIRIKRILNPLTVYIDPAAQEPDGSDARYVFVVEDIPRDVFEAEWGPDHAAEFDAFLTSGDRTADWAPEGKVRIAEYWTKDIEVVDLVMLQGGQRVLKADLPPDVPPEMILGERRIERPIVTMAKMTGHAILETSAWAGRHIPIVGVWGEELNVNGERIYRGVIRSSRDVQRLYNYWVSAATEMIALAPRAPFIGVEGQFEGHEAEWKQANVRNFAYLEYKPTSVAGAAAGPPQRQTFEPPIQAIMVAINQADRDIKATTGIFDPSLGNLSSSERSGRAILALQKQGEQANSNFLDSLQRAVTYTGKILVDLIPHIYDRPGRVVRTMGTDDAAQAVLLNQPFVPGPGGQPQPVPPGMPPPPQATQIDLAKGRYGVTVQVGRAYQTQRQEAVASMLELLSVQPAMAPAVADLVVQNMDWPGARMVAERLKKMLPPQLQDQPGQAPVPPQVQQQLQQAGQLIDALTQQLNAATEVIKQKQVEAQSDLQIKSLEVQSRERIAALQAQVELVKTEAQLKTQHAETLLHEQLETIRQMIETDQTERQTARQLQHETEMAQNDAATAAREATA